MITLNKKYNINNFVCHELDETLIVMHNKGIVKINETRLKGLIKSWDVSNQKKIIEEDLEITFKNDYKAALEFLLDNFILEEESEVNYALDSIVFASNNKCFSDFVKMSMFEEISIPKKIKTINLTDDFSVENNCLYVFFLNPYNKKFAAKIRDLIKMQKNSILLMSYMYNSNFYMDSFYFPHLHNPCHLCHIGHIESQLRVKTIEGISYQQIIDSIYLEDSDFSLHTPLTKRNLLNIVTLISNKLEKYIFLEQGLLVFPEELHECLMLDLQTNNVHMDYSLHWELCDCYE
ncbi:McbB family protein [Paenibacillus thiaminolyticus]|uniref:McbB family protein n=1 Tax=Paenibacillus thiaminolyticus TaxID=49283 RepID=UPI00232B7F07|nr:McbB family protein [Paenibacillus thiaminolyticus]WCF09053.1 McbB family protein [Paenibacillus thiaminolyticus]